MPSATFKATLAGEFAGPDGRISDFFGLQRLLDDPLISATVDPSIQDKIEPGALAEADGLLVMDQPVDAQVLDDAGNLRIVARYGVGTNSVDLTACTDRGVLVTITPEGVARPVASSALTLVLALAHRLTEKQDLLRRGRWNERSDVIGIGLRKRTIGIVGFGRTGRELAKLVSPFGARVIAYDPYVEQAAAGPGVGIVPLERLLREADFVVLMSALTPETWHLISEQRLALMKESAYLVNVARGPLVDQAALTSVLQAGALAGAGLDVFEDEPPRADDPLLDLPNVIVTPHSLCWTDECFNGNGHSAARALSAVAHGLIPDHVANPEVLKHPRTGQLRHKNGS